MSPASPSIPSSDSRLKWKKRKHEDDDDDDEDEDDYADNDDESAPIHAPSPLLDLPVSEVLADGGHRIADFPLTVRRFVTRPHPSLLALLDRSPTLAPSYPPPFLENISHGQLQALSAFLPDNPSFLQPSDPDRPSAFVCTPPPLMESKGVVKRFGADLNRILPVPTHSDWFSPLTVHRLERQVVPHFFSGKSAEQTPELYIALRNRIIGKYMESPERRLSFSDCQGLVPGELLYDLSRIVRFLDHWGVINYLAASSLHKGLRTAPSLLKEEGNGELKLQLAPLKSIDSLILFDRPKCSIRAEEIALLSSSSASVDSEAALHDLDSRIRERLSEHTCSYCSCALPALHYQSQKEADIIICSNCFHDAKFISGHSSVDFLRVDSKKDIPDLDGDSWTDQETLLLLESLEKYNGNWNEIAEHVGTKSKAQCILHFVRLPMEDGLLENIEIPRMAISSDFSKEHNSVLSCSNSNGDSAGFGLQYFDPAKQLPFANATNPVMSLVAFLASAIGPRVAAACAGAALSVLTKGDSRLLSESTHTEVGSYEAHANSGHRKEETPGDQVPYAKKDAPLAPEHVKLAAMSGLSAAAMKSKLFADQEEREIQRQAATCITHQLKRLELKLKQFAEVETLLMKECEQIERARQRLSTERIRMVSSTRFGPTGTSLSPSAGPTAATAAPASTSARQSPMPPSAVQVAPNISPAYGNNLPGHPQMPFVQRQQMFGFGPRLPLSAINPSPGPPSPNVMFNSGMPNTSSAPNHHRLLRSPSSGNSR